MQTFAVDRKRRRLFTLATMGAVMAVAGHFDARAAEPRVIKVSARRFVFTPNQIKLAPHENVVFELTALDTVMGSLFRSSTCGRMCRRGLWCACRRRLARLGLLTFCAIFFVGRGMRR
ncbi:hypothetical protein PPGU19_019410 [Paraburkholderia sp. PGU19]|nr:hypothetical protein PPGU19_019410 [Paraburkholderia sp. PGU19]